MRIRVPLDFFCLFCYTGFQRKSGETMQFEALTKQQIRSVYKKYLTKDFPADERRPLARILKTVDNGNYEAYALTEEGQVLSYAFFLRNGSTYLLDYLATNEAHRNQGLGAAILSQASSRLTNASCVLAEIEDPACAETAQEQALRTRRQQFYARCGFLDTGLRADTFGVRFVLIELPGGEAHSAQALQKIYFDLYRTTLPERIVRRFIKIAGETTTVHRT